MNRRIDDLTTDARSTGWLHLYTHVGLLAGSRQAAETTGGVAHMGHPEPPRTVVDIALSRYDDVWAAGGHPHYVFPTSYDELMRITAGAAGEVGA